MNRKANCISAIVLGLLWLIIEVLSIDSLLIELVVRFLVLFTAVLGYLAYRKKESWNLLSWLWSTFLLPLFSAEFLIIIYLGHFVPVETIAVWGFPVFLSLMPPTLWGMMKWFRSVFAETYQTSVLYSARANKAE